MNDHIETPTDTLLRLANANYMNLFTLIRAFLLFSSKHNVFYSTLAIFEGTLDTACHHQMITETLTGS